MEPNLDRESVVDDSVKNRILERIKEQMAQASSEPDWPVPIYLKAPDDWP